MKLFYSDFQTEIRYRKERGKLVFYCDIISNNGYFYTKRFEKCELPNNVTKWELALHMIMFTLEDIGCN